ncbi:hypothetical protein GCM10010521_29970 [Streptomyces rameus]|uniref:Uncharacterized protein n=1 Tax=Streptomyces rameus TaxID=68261 RepID=A0ABP6NCG5_9ACTN
MRFATPSHQAPACPHNEQPPPGASNTCASTHPWGAIVELPPPVGITLGTEKLKDYAG